MFELQFLLNKYEAACRAAFRMQVLSVESWMVKTTLQNMKIIKASPRSDNDTAFNVLQFWFQYLGAAPDSAPTVVGRKLVWPALLSERELSGDRYHPCIVELMAEDGHVSIANVTANSPTPLDAESQPMLAAGDNSAPPQPVCRRNSVPRGPCGGTWGAHPRMHTCLPPTPC